MPLEYKDRMLGNEINVKIVEALDYVFFDGLKIYISKRFKSKVREHETYSAYLKEKKDVDIYNLIDFILDGLKESNFIINKDTKTEQLEKLNHLVDQIKGIKASVKKMDDIHIEEEKFANELKELLEQMKELVPRNKESHNKSKQERLADLEKTSKIVDKMDEKKLVNDILDKMNGYGKTSLTLKEYDLDSYSKESLEHNDYDVSFFMTKLKDKWSSDDIQSMVEEEKAVWFDDYEDGIGFAEDMILTKLISWFESKYKPLTDEVYEETYDKLQVVYKFLKIN
jgi:hypothetical protein